MFYDPDLKLRAVLQIEMGAGCILWIGLIQDNQNPVPPSVIKKDPKIHFLEFIFKQFWQRNFFHFSHLRWSKAGKILPFFKGFPNLTFGLPPPTTSKPLSCNSKTTSSTTFKSLPACHWSESDLVLILRKDTSLRTHLSRTVSTFKFKTLWSHSSVHLPRMILSIENFREYHGNIK